MTEKKNLEKIEITPRTLSKLRFNQDGLIPAIVQDYKTKDVLMMAYMNLDSLKAALKTGKASYWSRSRQQFWMKGETSGHYQFIKGIWFDCDCDTLLIKVRQIGAACHTMERSCFYRKIKTKT